MIQFWSIQINYLTTLNIEIYYPILINVGYCNISMNPFSFPTKIKSSLTANAVIGEGNTGILRCLSSTWAFACIFNSGCSYILLKN